MQYFLARNHNNVVCRLQALFPQLAGVELDAAHASRRFLRPWNVLAETSVVVNELVRAKDSFPQMLHHSRPFRNVYEKHLQQATGGLGSRSSSHLAAAKHRFESIARPLGRLCLHLSGASQYGEIHG